MIRICISGAVGRMGSEIINTCIADGGVEISGLIEKPGSDAVGKNIEGIAVAGDISACGTSDCLIEFTDPGATVEHLERLTIPAVIGTTGFTQEEIVKIRNFSAGHPVVLAPNMSRGVNLLFSLAGKVAKQLDNYDVEIVEAHHNRKKDAPSGTAKRLAEVIKDARDLEYVYGRHGNTGARGNSELGIHAVRAGDIVGEHTVLFAGPGECVELVHRAYSRACFARGAVDAAKWIMGKGPGLYTMNDVLGI